MPVSSPATACGTGPKRRPTSADRASIDDLVSALASGTVERTMNRRIGRYIEACSLVEHDGFLSDLTSRHRFALHIEPEVRREQELYKRLSVALVFRSPQVCQLEHKGQMMITRLFTALAAEYLDREPQRPHLRLLSRDFEREIARDGLDVPARARILCDYLAGMTDGFAARVYRRMFDPGYGSIVDLV